MAKVDHRANPKQGSIKPRGLDSTLVALSKLRSLGCLIGVVVCQLVWVRDKRWELKNITLQRHSFINNLLPFVEVASLCQGSFFFCLSQGLSQVCWWYTLCLPPG